MCCNYLFIHFAHQRFDIDWLGEVVSDLVLDGERGTGKSSRV
jgi:hypothetical protein